MRTLLQDLRYGMRTLRKAPGFACVAVMAIALGIGSSTAIFSVVNAVLLRPLAYRDPGRLVLIRERILKVTPDPLSVPAPDVLDFQSQTRVFESVAGYQNERYDLSGQGQPQRIDAARVTANLFRLLGVQPLLGRTFSAEEDQPGRLVAVLSYGLWQRRFGADPAVAGKTVLLDRQPYTVLGVMPRDFDFPMQGIPSARPAELWVPMAFTKAELAAHGDNFNYGVVARMRPGITIERANSDLAPVAARIHEALPPDVRNEFDLEAIALPLQDQIVGPVKRLLLVLLGAVGFVLLIACANVASLLLGRAAARHRELAIRTALGAARSRVVRQLLTESLLLAAIGGAFGLLFADWGVKLFVALTAESIPRVTEVRMDPAVLGFSLLLSILTGAFFGVFPALAASRSSVNEALREGGKGSTPGLRRNRARGALVVAEVALALILLIGAGLLVRSFQHLRETDPGFAPEQILSLSLSLPESQYAMGDSMRAFHQQLQSKLESLPGVRAVGQGTDLPLAGANWTRIFTAQDHPVQAGDKVPMNAHTVVSGNYFEALGIPLKRGRLFTAEDGPKSVPVLVVNETMARRIWPGEDPIGKRIKWGPPQGKEPWQTVVGVVGDSKQGALDQETMPHTYESYVQANDETGRAMSVAVRAAIAPASLTTAVRARISSLDRELPIAKLQSMEHAVTESMAPRQFNMMIVALFASAALLLAALGIYGVMAYSVTQRTQEIGVRMALGARRTDVLRMVVGQGLALAGAGVVIGLACAYGLTRLMEGLLFGVTPTDPYTFVGISLLLLLVALLASYLPARRATQVDPMVALRCE